MSEAQEAINELGSAVGAAQNQAAYLQETGDGEVATKTYSGDQAGLREAAREMVRRRERDDKL